MQKRWGRLTGVVGLLALALALVLGAAPAQAQSQLASSGGKQTTEEIYSQAVAADDIFVPCALGGVGEYVHLSGSEVVRLRTTNYLSGAFKVDLRVKYDGVMGVGLTSGEPYKVTNKIKNVQSGILPYPITSVYKEKLKLKGLISKTKFRTYNSTTITIDANGIETRTEIGPLYDCRSKSQPDYKDDD